MYKKKITIAKTKQNKQTKTELYMTVLFAFQHWLNLGTYTTQKNLKATFLLCICCNTLQKI